jgi:hypothetical protein
LIDIRDSFDFPFTPLQMATKKKSPAKRDDKPWTAELGEDGFYRVVNDLGVVLAQKCVKEEAELFAAAPELLDLLRRLDAYLSRPFWERDQEESIAVQKKLDDVLAKANGDAE